MTILNPYLYFDGNCEEAFQFYQSVFGGNFGHVGRFNEMPPQYEVPEAETNRLMHISLPIGGGSVLMGSDILPSHTPNFDAGNGFAILIAAETKEEADRLFTGLSKGGKITLPIADTFWGSYFGGLTDKFGKQWMVSFAS